MYRRRRIVGFIVAIALLVAIGFGVKALVGAAQRFLQADTHAPTATADGGLFGEGGLFGPATPTPEVIVPVTGEMEILNFLMRGDLSESKRITGQLAALTERKDTTGYYANLYLAALREQGVAEDPPPSSTLANPAGSAAETVAESGSDAQTGVESGSDAQTGIESSASTAMARQLNRTASAAYRKALDLYDSPEVRFQLAQALENEADVAAALAEYAKLLPDQAALERIQALAPDPVTGCDILLKKGMATEVTAILKPLLAQTAEGSLRQQLLVCQAVAVASSGDYALAVSLFEALPEGARSLAEGAADAALADAGETSAVSLPTTHPAQVAWWYARALEGAGEAKKAIAVYGTLGSAGGERLGALLEKNGDAKGAANAYLSAPNAAAKWLGAKLSERLGRTTAALEGYLAIASGEGTLQDDAAYRAYILLKRQGNQEGEAAGTCLAILSEYPAWQERLGMEIVFPETPEGEAARPAFLDRVEQFEAEGRDELSRLELAIGRYVATPGEKLYLAQWYLDKGDTYTSVIWGMRALLDEPSRLGYQYAYPRAFEAEVTRYAEEYGMDPLLLWGIIRTESTYRPDVLSRSGAIGLMQIMPPTGQDIAGRLGVTITDEDLKNPEINVRFGAFYISAMIRQYGGDWDKALAAYNGGPGNVNKWSRDAFVKQPEDFPTVIPFDETREYITKVMEAYHRYKWLEKGAVGSP